MIILDLKVELTGNQVLINGVEIPAGTAKFDETVFRRRLHPEHIWSIACELRKLSFMAAMAYDEARHREGEITAAERERGLAVIKAKRKKFGDNDPLAALFRKGKA